jgi:hypothetical protein
MARGLFACKRNLRSFDVVLRDLVRIIGLSEHSLFFSILATIFIIGYVCDLIPFSGIEQFRMKALPILSNIFHSLKIVYISQLGQYVRPY